MAGIFLNLPCPAANGSGAWVDCSTLGAARTIVVGSVGAAALKAQITIEITNEAVATTATPVKTFENTGILSVPIAARWMRCTVTGYKFGTPQVDVGGPDNGCSFVNVVAPAVNGAGAAADTSALGPFKTVTVGNAFTGALIIEASVDGGVTWGQVIQFTASDQQSASFMAERVRVVRSGLKAGGQQPIVNIGADNPPSGSSFTNAQLFRYVATGLEGDSFVVPLPAARANADYFVFVLQSTVPIAAKVPNTSRTGAARTINDFVFEISSPADAGDEWEFLVAGG